MKGSKSQTLHNGTQKVRRAILFINPNNKQARDLGVQILDELALLNIKTDTFNSKGQTNSLSLCKVEFLSDCLF